MSLRDISIIHNNKKGLFSVPVKSYNASQGNLVKAPIFQVNTPDTYLSGAPGDSYTVNFQLQNIGNATGTCEVQLKDSGGVVLASASHTMNPEDVVNSSLSGTFPSGLSGNVTWTLNGYNIDRAVVDATLNINVDCNPWIIGVMDTGGRTADGATLEWIDKDGNILSSVPTSFFDSHPSYQFDELITGGNYFRRIPIAYWKRGTGPAGSDAAGKWCMWISALPVDGFAASPYSFKRNDAWMEQFYYGTYRAFNNGGVPGSQPDKTHWDTVSFDAFKSAATSMGDGHHMVSLFEWQEILSRMVIEKKTFNLFPESVRATKSLCQWRGIQEMAYSGSVYAEWMDGVRNGASSVYEVWDQAGGSFVSTGVVGIATGTNYATKFLSGGAFDFLYLAETAASSGFIVPDLTPYYNNANTICYSFFYSSGGYSGSFDSDFYHSSSSTRSVIGSRIAKW